MDSCLHFVQRYGNFGISVASLALESMLKTMLGSCSESEGVLAGTLALADLRMGVRLLLQQQ